MSNQWYLAFGASDKLFALNNDYRGSLAIDSEKVQSDKLYALLSEFADECLDQYFLSPIERIQLDGVGKKMVVGGVSAIKKTIHLTLKQVIKKMSAQDRKQLADYINNLMLPLRESELYPTYIAVPVDDDLHKRLREPSEKGRETPSEVVEAYTHALCELIDLAVEAYMGQPIRMLKLGMVMNKIANVASDTIKGAAHTVVRKVGHSMGDKELLNFFDFSESILFQMDQAKAA